MNKEEQITKLSDKIPLLEKELSKKIIGQKDAIKKIMISLLAGGHSLLEGVPGLGKTLMVRSLAEVLSVDFNRIQFTPDLMPSDISGTEILQENPDNGKRSLEFRKGPIFTNLLLADEINRTPPKTQAALLEAMQEFELTYGGKSYPLPRPFFILSTQNPIEQSGTFPLPEAQLDRFLLFIELDYPNEEEEIAMLENTTGLAQEALKPQMSGEDILALQKWVREVYIDRELVKWVAALVRSTRAAASGPEPSLAWGAGPRAGQALILCAKAKALYEGRFSVRPEDISWLAHSVLSHRLVLSYKAQAEQKSKADIIEDLLSKHPIEQMSLSSK